MRLVLGIALGIASGREIISEPCAGQYIKKRKWKGMLGAFSLIQFPCMCLCPFIFSFISCDIFSFSFQNYFVFRFFLFMFLSFPFHFLSCLHFPVISLHWLSFHLLSFFPFIVLPSTVIFILYPFVPFHDPFLCSFSFHFLSCLPFPSFLLCSFHFPFMSLLCPVISVISFHVPCVFVFSNFGLVGICNPELQVALSCLQQGGFWSVASWLLPFSLWLPQAIAFCNPAVANQHVFEVSLFKGSYPSQQENANSWIGWQLT